MTKRYPTHEELLIELKRQFVETDNVQAKEIFANAIKWLYSQTKNKKA